MAAVAGLCSLSGEQLAHDGASFIEGGGRHAGAFNDSFSRKRSSEPFNGLRIIAHMVVLIVPGGVPV